MRRRPLAALLLFALVLLSGCWDLRELDQLALVMAVGVDKAETPGRLLVTVQIARPSGGGGGVAKGGAGGGGAVYTASAEGDTIFAAVRNLAQFTSRRIMWAHNNVVIIGEALAREDITPVIDFFTRNQELRMRTWVVVARGGDAREFVAAKTGMEQIPANSISALFRYGQLPGEAVSSDMGEAASAFFSPDSQVVISALGIRRRAIPEGDMAEEHGGDQQVELTGSAVFQETRLVGFLDRDAGRGLLWLRGDMKNAVLTLPCPGDVPRGIAVEVRSPAVRVDSTLVGGKPEFHVTVKAEGLLSEQDCQTPQYDNVSFKAYLEREYARKIEQNIRAALTVLQEELGVDGIRFGRRVHVQHPAWWRANRHRWPEVFQTVKTRVHVTATIPKQGLYIRPMKLYNR